MLNKSIILTLLLGATALQAADPVPMVTPTLYYYGNILRGTPGDTNMYPLRLESEIYKAREGIAYHLKYEEVGNPGATDAILDTTQSWIYTNSNWQVDRFFKRVDKTDGSFVICTNTGGGDCVGLDLPEPIWEFSDYEYKEGQVIPLLALVEQETGLTGAVYHFRYAHTEGVLTLTGGSTNTMYDVVLSVTVNLHGMAQAGFDNTSSSTLSGWRNKDFPLTDDEQSILAALDGYLTSPSPSSSELGELDRLRKAYPPTEKKSWEMLVDRFGGIVSRPYTDYEDHSVVRQYITKGMARLFAQNLDPYVIVNNSVLTNGQVILQCPGGGSVPIKVIINPPFGAPYSLTLDFTAGAVTVNTDYIKDASGIWHLKGTASLDDTATGTLVSHSGTIRVGDSTDANSAIIKATAADTVTVRNAADSGNGNLVAGTVSTTGPATVGDGTANAILTVNAGDSATKSATVKMGTTTRDWSMIADPWPNYGWHIDYVGTDISKANILVLDRAGFVGVNNGSPSSALDVTGSIELSGNLNFGAATSSNPMLKPFGTALKVRTGDDSGDAAISASSFQGNYVQVWGQLNGSVLGLGLNSGGSVTLDGNYIGVYLITTSSATVTLPTAVGYSGQVRTIKVVSPATSGTVSTTSSQTIDGAASYSLSAQNKYVTVVSDGSNWKIIGNN